MRTASGDPGQPAAAADRPKPPSAKTLASYGLTADEWLALCAACNYTCVVCNQPFGTRPLAIDHEHVKGWRARKPKLKSGRRRPDQEVRVMSPAERKKYVRGILHSFCNRYIRRWMTRERIDRIKAYLDDYHQRMGRSP